jgi:hypothetical protein
MEVPVRDSSSSSSYHRESPSCQKCRASSSTRKEVWYKEGSLYYKHQWIQATKEESFWENPVYEEWYGMFLASFIQLLSYRF